jgi:hypothetical protein
MNYTIGIVGIQNYPVWIIFSNYQSVPIMIWEQAGNEKITYTPPQQKHADAENNR